MPSREITGVLCCGNVCFDMPVWPVDRMAWGTSTWVETIGESLGGNGGNTSYALARLGVPVRLTGVVGTDANGDKVLSALNAAGVDAGRVRRDRSVPTTATVVVVHPSGDRLFLHLPGASKSLEASEVLLNRGDSLSHFHLANPYSLPKVRTQGAELLARARSAGFTTSLDTGYDSQGRWLEDIGPCLPFTDLLFVNETELQFLSGEQATTPGLLRLAALGAGDVVVKLGGRGCALMQGGEISEFPGFSVPVKDTSGAGDSFVGGFLASLHRQRSYRESARFANAVGACKVQALGAAQGVLTFDETERWIASQKATGGHAPE
ncbi:MAG TPA: carbohydrate kinase family protein [Bryobacteraceae bacterium]|nr:carbohydrate kinase family protein [Bryobacteraceae bacterium]